MLETVDEVDEGLKELYVEQDVKIGQKTEKRWVLQVEGVEDHPRVKNLQTAHEKQKEETRFLRRENDTFKERLEGVSEEFNAQVYNDLKTKAEGKTNNAQEQLDRLKADLEKKHTKEVTDREKKIDTLTKGLKATMIDGGLNEALGKAGVSKDFIGAARALLKEQGGIELVEEEGKFQVLATTSLGKEPLEDFVKNWAGSDEGKPYIAQPVGDNAPGNERRRLNSGTNPFDRTNGKKPNLTDIQNAWVADAAKARSMAHAAGWSDRELQNNGLK